MTHQCMFQAFNKQSIVLLQQTCGI